MKEINKAHDACHNFSGDESIISNNIININIFQSKALIMILFKSLTVILLCIFFSPVFSQEKAGKKDTSSHATFYTCPKHSDIKSEKAGHCPTCGMKLEQTPKEKMKSEVTKAYTCPVHTDIVGKNSGKCPKCGKDLVRSSKEKMKMQIMKMYSCPMHSDVTSKTPGKCPKCNMDMVEEKKKDHSEHQ
jgi:uncharacterized protein with PIN domain